MKTIVLKIEPNVISINLIKKDSLILIYKWEEIIGSLVWMKEYSSWRMCIPGISEDGREFKTLFEVMSKYTTYTFKTTQKD